jgi:hypothetical protein
MKMRQSVAEQLERMRERYRRRNREGKSRILDEVCEQYGYSRKHAIKLLRGRLKKPSGRKPPGPACRYHPVEEILEQIWRTAEQLCGKRLVAALPLWLPHYPKHFNPLLPCQKKLLNNISAATADRLLAGIKSEALRGISGTRPGTLLRTQVPLQGEVWDEQRPGFIEADSVAHCGSSLAGDFVWSLTFTDLASTWTEGRAVWNKGAAGVLDQTRDVESSLPFVLLGLDFDNGTEWLNWTLIRYLQKRARPIQVTRSRPYHKDDNAHVEQKNWMWPRQLLGYGRLSDPAVVPLINCLYKDTWGLFQNFFLPSMKLKEKWRVGSRWVRRYEPPRTAYQRLLSSPLKNTRSIRSLRDIYEALDPFLLAQEVEKQLQPIFHAARLALSPQGQASVLLTNHQPLSKVS